MPQPKIAVGYLRVSTKQQAGEDRMGRDAQKEAIAKYADENNYKIIRWYTDEESGVKEHREALDEILFTDELEQAGVQAVIAYKSDRFARDIKLYFYYLFTLEKRHISLVSVNERFDDDEYGLSSVYRSLMLFVAEQERKNITMRTTGGRKMKAQRGGYAGGRLPYGYTVFGHKLVVNEDEAQIVRTIFLLREQGCVMQEISDILNDRGYRTRKGRYFTASQVGSILKNQKFYQGYYKYGDMKDYVKGQHEPIIFKRIKAIHEIDIMADEIEREEQAAEQPKRPTYELNIECDDDSNVSDYEAQPESDKPVRPEPMQTETMQPITVKDEPIDHNEPDNDHIEPPQIGADIELDEPIADEPQHDELIEQRQAEPKRMGVTVNVRKRMEV
jgi:DNA invertase Pin-like site-specific DNA recombinase